jgi:hypothetical protein
VQDPDLAALAAAFPGQAVVDPSIVGGAQLDIGLHDLVYGAPQSIALLLPTLSQQAVTDHLAALQARYEQLLQFDPVATLRVRAAGPDPVSFILALVSAGLGCSSLTPIGAAGCVIGLALLTPVCTAADVTCHYIPNATYTECVNTSTQYPECDNTAWVNDPQLRLSSISELTSCIKLTGLGATAPTQAGTFCAGPPPYYSYNGSVSYTCRQMYNTVPPNYGLYCQYALTGNMGSFSYYNCAYVAEGYFIGRFNADGSYF